MKNYFCIVCILITSSTLNCMEKSQPPAHVILETQKNQEISQENSIKNQNQEPKQEVNNPDQDATPQCDGVTRYAWTYVLIKSMAKLMSKL